MALLLLALASWIVLPSFAAPAPTTPSAEASHDPIDAIEDPRLLHRLGREAVETGDRDRARRLFERMFERHEVTRYLGYRPNLRDALVLEHLGDADEAATAYRAAFDDDVLRVVQVLRIMSRHPEREALVAEAYAHVRALVDAAKAGEDAKIYTTSKGAPRYLKVMTTQQVIDASRRGEKVSYCYVDDLDFTAVRGEMPDKIVLSRCVLGRLFGPNTEFEQLVFKGFVLGDTDLGKAWKGEPNKSPTIQPSVFRDLVMREAVFVGRANFAAVEVTEGRAYFPLTVFEGEADFKGAEFFGVTEFRFASFGEGANFRFMRMYQPVYFGGTRYRADTVFGSVFSERDVYFNSAVFEGDVSFDNCEFKRGATFENSRFFGTASFGATRIEETLNLSRSMFHGPMNIKEVELGGLDALGAHFQDDAWFMDAVIRGRARFSLDEVTRHSVREDIDELLPLYRHYQGDEDADAPLTTTSSYGVQSVEDLNSAIDKNISFANTVFGGYTVFEGVKFGQPDTETVASFFNSQFLGETHFEHTEWFGQADFSTIFGTEVAFNNALFHHALILDDANVAGRMTLTDARFAGTADLSLYGSEIRSLQVSPDQVRGVDDPHRLFYERCAYGEVDRSDVRVERLEREGVTLTDAELRAICFDFTIDEFIALKDSYGDRAMTTAEDDAYWWTRHHQAQRDFRFGGFVTKVRTVVVDMLLFELCFGWGVRLGNLGIAVVLLTVVFALLYRVFCPDTILAYDGEDIPIRDVSFLGLCFVSLQSLIAINTGWDFGDDNHVFRWLNTIETVIGFIILTFFVGAYTRMILA